MINFWAKLNKPIYVLAPMAGITDSAFRQICKEFGADVVYSEMASATALAYNPKKTLEMLRFDKAERPYVIQLFGSKPEHFAKAVKRLSLYDFNKNRRGSTSCVPEGIDINFGCPVKKIAKQGAGAVLMNDLKLSREIMKAVINNIDLPISIKMRSKVGKINVFDFLKNVEDLDIKAIMIHGRTLSQGFSGSVDTEIIKKARDYFNGIILANGGVMSADGALELLDKTEADGVGIARGALGRPWIFRSLKALKNYEDTERKEKIFKIALMNAKLAEKLKGERGIVEMRKHLCWYARGLPGACEMRQRLVKVKTIKDIEKILR